MVHQLFAKELVLVEPIISSRTDSGYNSSRCVILSSDNAFAIVARGNILHVVSASTGQVVRQLVVVEESILQEKKPSTIITCIAKHQNEAHLVYASYSDGVVRCWDYVAGSLLHHFITGLVIRDMNVRNNGVALTLSSLVSDQSKATYLRSFVFPSASLESYNIASSVKLLHEKRFFHIAVKDDLCLAATKHNVRIFKIQSNGDASLVYHYEHHFVVTAVIFHPVESSYLLGDETGRIWINHGVEAVNTLKGGQVLKSTSKCTQQNVLHWHAHGVFGLSITPDGEYLLSGGNEGVLVRWQLSSGHKQFLPRLGAEFSHIILSDDSSLYACVMKDGSLHLIMSLNMSVKHSLFQLRLGHSVGQGQNERDWMSCEMSVEPSHGHLILPSLPGSLQIYDVLRDKNVGEIEVAPQNLVSTSNSAETIYYSKVTHSIVSSDGSWMATSDSRTGDKTYLKIWQYNSTTRTFVLNTRIDSPHGQHAVTSLAFQHGAQPLLVSCGGDNQFKFWKATAATRRQAKLIPGSFSWSCQSVGFYRNLPCVDAVFSMDNSIFACAHNDLITLWDTQNFSLLGTLIGPQKESLRKMIFIQGNYLVGYTESTFCVWNLLTCMIWWNHKLKVSHLAPLTSISPSHVVIVTEDLASKSKPQSILVIDVATSLPSFAQVLDCRVRSLSVLPRSDDALFQERVFGSVRHDDKSMSDGVASICYLDVNNTLRSLILSKRILNAPTVTTERNFEAPLKEKIAFASVFGIDVASKPRDENYIQVSESHLSVTNSIQDVSNEILSSAQSNSLPAIRTIFNSMMKSILRPSSVEKVNISKIEVPYPVSASQESEKRESKDMNNWLTNITEILSLSDASKSNGHNSASFVKTLEHHLK